MVKEVVQHTVAMVNKDMGTSSKVDTNSHNFSSTVVILDIQDIILLLNSKVHRPHLQQQWLQHRRCPIPWLEFPKNKRYICNIFFFDTTSFSRQTLIMRVLAMTPEQINMLPPADRATYIQIVRAIHLPLCFDY